MVNCSRPTTLSEVFMLGIGARRVIFVEGPMTYEQWQGSSLWWQKQFYKRILFWSSAPENTSDFICSLFFFSCCQSKFCFCQGKTSVHGRGETLDDDSQIVTNDLMDQSFSVPEPYEDYWLYNTLLETWSSWKHQERTVLELLSRECFSSNLLTAVLIFPLTFLSVATFFLIHPPPPTSQDSGFVNK